jgi:hypothetical protein
MAPQQRRERQPCVEVVRAELASGLQRWGLDPGSGDSGVRQNARQQCAVAVFSSNRSITYSEPAPSAALHLLTVAPAAGGIHTDA